MAAAVEAFGHVDVLVCNHARSSEGSLGQLTAAELDASFAVNTRAVLLLVQAFAARHAGRPGGGWCCSPPASSWGRCRASWPMRPPRARWWGSPPAWPTPGRPRITVNTVNPGRPTPATPTRRPASGWRRRFPAGRWGAPDDAARLVAWLCTDEAAWITGQVINSEAFRRFG